MTEETPPLPPDTELLNRQPKWFMPVFKGVVVASILFGVVAALFVLAGPVIFRATKKSYQVEAISNAKQIGLALFEFENEFGFYPNAATLPLVNAKHPTHTLDLTGNSSNSLFRQIFAAEITESEELFYARIQDSQKPDGNIAPSEALKKGEVGFAYISGLSTKDDPNTPIVLAPIIHGTTKFDPKPFKGKAIVLHNDQIVRSYDIDKDGHIKDSTGINLLSPKHPIWNGKAPTIHYPE